MSFFETKGDCGCNRGCGGCGFGDNGLMLILLLTCCGGCGTNMGCIDVCELFFIIFLLSSCGHGCQKSC